MARFFRVYALLVGFTFLSLISLNGLSAAGPAGASDTEFFYNYDGKAISLNASKSLFAVSADGTELRNFSAATGWKRDPLSDEHAAREHGFSLYRGMPSDPKSDQWQSRADALSTARVLGVPTQPVFESGGAIQIPSNEVIIGFDHEFTADEAWDLLSLDASAEGLLDLRPLRRKTFVVTISDAADGRAFAVSRALATLPGVAYAEPNFVVIMMTGPSQHPSLLPDRITLPEEIHFESLTPSLNSAPTSPAPQSSFAPVGWTTLVSDGFESGAPGWITTWSGIEAQPVIQGLRKRTGSKAIYMTGGGAQGVPAPGPYPNDANAFLFSPTLNLSPFEEAYVEFWFYAKYEDPGTSPWDFGRIAFFDNGNPNTAFLFSFLNVAYTGDLTADPTTQGGWRRVLFRVPPAWRRANIRVGVSFHSDFSITREGLYVDNVRVLGTANVDTEPLGNDTYGARVYELRNSGQIADLGEDANDLDAPEAWASLSVADNVVVAVIDSGVDLGHPDLRLVTGYDAATGQPGGGPKSNTDNHGTAVAGNVGAIRNNGIGTIGTAPGVKIMPIHWGTTLSDLARSFDLAVQHGADVISNSWGWVGTPSATVTAAIGDALAAQRTVLFSAGNGPDRSPWTYDTAYPCNLTANTAVICVGASSPTDQHKNASSSDGLFFWGSSYVGAGPDVVAPGPWSYTTDRRGTAGYNQDSALTGIGLDYVHDFGGTSSSAPKVAGIVALMLSRDPSLSPGQVKSILRASAKDIDATGVDDRTGAGRVNASAAIASVLRFRDVPRDYWAWRHIEAIASAGITSGCGQNLYCPENPVTRAQMAVFLLRGIHGGDHTPAAATGNVFNDVSRSYWAAAWIEQFAAEGITAGCGGGNYCPDSNVTRAEMAVFLLRSKHGSSYTPPVATGTRFNDVPQSFWASGWIEQLAAEGITGGCGNGNYCPNDSVTRAQMAVFIQKTFTLPLP